MAIPFPHHRFTVEEYHRMAEVGILQEDDRVELIDGEIIALPPIGPEHLGHVNRAARRLSRLVSDGATVSIQNPIDVGLRSEPEPDVAILAFREDDYAAFVPRPQDVLLLIEVADSSLTYDRHTKAPIYARAGVRELWIVNLIDRVIEVYREPVDGTYRSVEVVRQGDVLRPAALSNISVPVSDLFV